MKRTDIYVGLYTDPENPNPNYYLFHKEDGERYKEKVSLTDGSVSMSKIYCYYMNKENITELEKVGYYES